MPREGKIARGRVYLRNTLEESFWPKVNKDGPIVPYVGTQCWLWTGSVKTSGYGEVGFDGKNMPAHRASLIIHGRPVAGPGQELCHKCDVRLCVNPDHIFIGTHTDNMQDCSNKGRTRQQQDPSTVCRGSKHGMAKLTEDSVRQIIAGVISGRTTKELCDIFGVEKSTINLILRVKNWKNVDRGPYRFISNGRAGWKAIPLE